ncbi:MAG: MBOAT family O-acyltransferase [Myxococcales bacterium]
MLFNSIEFWLFFAVVFAAVHLLAHRGQNLLLLGASYVFYAAWDWRFLSLILASTVVDYYAALAAEPGVGSDRMRRWAVVVSATVNLGILGVFKYFDFFIHSFANLFALPPDTTDSLLLGVLLPVGISFYTFQTMSYTLDVYARRLQPTRSFTDLALYVSLFPQLIAGPIERGSHLMPQVLSPRPFDPERLHSGVYLIVWGLFKKVCIADTLAHPVQVIYTSPDPTGPEVYIATMCFAVQIYSDFSGYTDIARGVGRMLGFDFMLNFNLPYLAHNPTDFWRRWHISLSTWLRDYLYISIGGNRKGAGRTYVNLMITMVLGGLWHGARFNFVLWGAYHGALLVVHRFFDKNEATERAAPLTTALKIAGMFHLTLFGWLLFRVETADQLVRLTSALLGPWHNWDSAWGLLTYALPVTAPLIAMQFWQARSGNLEVIVGTPTLAKVAFVTFCLSGVLLFNRSGGAPFIYFQF